jgi:DNA-binding response OmpR family regulator
MNTILVVDDKPNIRLLLKEYLTEQGFRVVTANNGREALFVARYEKPTLILLDIMMPEMDGYEFITTHRREASTPIIVITAKEEEGDAVRGLELGADDYIIKPVRMKELLSRIRAVLRRISRDTTDEHELRSGELMLNTATYQVKHRGESVNLTPTEFNLLAFLMASPNQVFSRKILLDHLVDKGYNGLERTINVHIRNLRTKVEPNPSEPVYIETVFGVGYKFVG